MCTLQACERCPKSEDVWLETSRVYAKQSRDNGKAVLARGVAQVCIDSPSPDVHVHLSVCLQVLQQLQCQNKAFAGSATSATCS